MSAMSTADKTHLFHAIQLEKLNWKIHLLFVTKDFKNCLELIENELRNSKGQSDYPLIVKGLILRQGGQIRDALELFQAANALNPKNIYSLKHIGRCLFLLGKYEASVQVYDEAERLGAEEWDLYHNRGMCFMKMGRYEQAIASFQQSNDISRHNQTFLMLGKVYEMTGDTQTALEVYMEALEFSPDNSEILTTVGLIYLRMGKSYRAFDYLGTSLTQDPKNPATILAAGSIIQDHNDMDVALVKYRVAATRIPNSAQLWNNIGMCFFGKKKFVAAISCLKKALYLDPFEWIVSYNLGIAHLSTGQSASAFHHLSASINLKPDYAPSYMYLAISLSRLNDFDNTCNSYAKAAELEPNNHIIKLNYSITMFNHGHLKQSKQLYEEFLQLWDRLEDVQKANENDTANTMNTLRMKLKITN